MKIILVFLIQALLFISSSWAQGKIITLGYLETGLKDLNVADRQVALQLLTKELTRGSDLEFSVIAFNNMQDMLASIKSGKLNYTIINSYFYLKEYESLQAYILDEVWSIQRSYQPKEDYVLVTGNQFQYKDISSLKNKRLAIHKDHLLQAFYLNYLVQENSGTDFERFFQTIKDTRTDSQSVLDVFFKTSDVCIVPSYIIDLVTELNPAVAKGINIVHHSGAHFIPALVLTFKGLPEYEANIIKHNLQILPDSVRGQEILNLFDIISIRKTDLSSIKIMHNFFKKIN